jgi:hypothetical protein
MAQIELEKFFLTQVKHVITIEDCLLIANEPSRLYCREMLFTNMNAL